MEPTSSRSVSSLSSPRTVVGTSVPYFTADSLGYDEPEPLPFAARHWLGAVLLELERYAEAEQVYRDEIADHPHNGWSLFGLKTAIESQGRTDPAVDADLEASWARSDTWLRSSRF